MPAIKKIGYTNIFSQINERSRENGETNDCAVKAVSIAARVTYSAALNELTLRGRKARTGTYTHDIITALRTFGKTVTAIDPRSIIDTYPSPHNVKATCITTHHPRRFAKAWPKGTYLLFVKRHVAAVVDGELHDWTVNSAKKVIAIYKVE